MGNLGSAGPSQNSLWPEVLSFRARIVLWITSSAKLSVSLALSLSLSRLMAYMLRCQTLVVIAMQSPCAGCLKRSRIMWGRL